MAYHSDAETFTVALPENIWLLIDQIADEQGYKDTRRFINVMIRRVAHQFQNIQHCQGKKDKKQKLFSVPPHLEQTMRNVSCIAGLPISTIMTMYILTEALKNVPDENEVKTTT